MRKKDFADLSEWEANNELEKAEWKKWISRKDRRRNRKRSNWKMIYQFILDFHTVHNISSGRITDMKKSRIACDPPRPRFILDNLDFNHFLSCYMSTAVILKIACCKISFPWHHSDSVYLSLLLFTGSSNDLQWHQRTYWLSLFDLESLHKWCHNHLRMESYPMIA